MSLSVDLYRTPGVRCVVQSSFALILLLFILVLSSSTYPIFSVASCLIIPLALAYLVANVNCLLSSASETT